MIDLAIRGIGFWAPGVPDWAQARALLAAGADWPSAGGRPTTTLMPPNERRRAPDSVLLALGVAEQACTAAALAPASLPSVFVSAYGDLAINDYMCATLRDDPAQMSPTRFHNSVHNAPSGYWSIATGAMTAATSIAGFRESFAAGLLEAASQLADGDGPLLLVAYDVAAIGPMAEVAESGAPFGCAFVLDRAQAAAHAPILRLATVAGGVGPVAPAHRALAALAEVNPIAAGAAVLLEGLATDAAVRIVLPVSAGLDLALVLRP
jgi:hypothetical protein